MKHIDLLPPRPRPEEPEFPFVGQLVYQGVPIDIETNAGEYRSGIDENGKAWRVKMPAAYGEARGTIGSDGDAVDVFVGANPFAPFVYVVQTKNPRTGAYDEHKSVLGVDTQAEALALVRAAYDIPIVMGVTRWTFGAWAEALRRPEVSASPMAKPLEKADALVNLELAEQLSLFAREQVTPGPLVPRPAAPTAVATPPWIQVHPFTRKGGVMVRSHMRAHTPGTGGHFEPAGRPAARRAHMRDLAPTVHTGPDVDAVRGASFVPSTRNRWDGTGEHYPAPPRWLGDPGTTIVRNLSPLDLNGQRVSAAIAKVQTRQGTEWRAVVASGTTPGTATWSDALLGTGETPPWGPVAPPEPEPDQHLDGAVLEALQGPLAPVVENDATFVDPYPPGGPISFASPDEIDDTLAARSHQNTSFSPERRAEQEKASYVAEVNDFYATAMRMAHTPEEKRMVLAHATYVRGKYRDAYHARLSAMANTSSWMVTGPAGRNARREQKRSETADRRTGELLEILPEGLARIGAKLKAHRIEVAGGAAAVEEAKLAQLQRNHELMRGANAIWRSKKPEAAKLEAMAALFSMTPDEPAITRLLTNKTTYDNKALPPFEAFKLTNNNANIKRVAARVQELRGKESARDALEAETGDTESSHPFTGTLEFPYSGTVTYDHADQRIRLAFDQRLPREAYDAIARRTGFNWSRKHNAFSHVMGSTGAATAKRITGADLRPMAKAVGADEEMAPELGKVSPGWTALQDPEVRKRANSLAAAQRARRDEVQRNLQHPRLDDGVMDGEVRALARRALQGDRGAMSRWEWLTDYGNGVRLLPPPPPGPERERLDKMGTTVPYTRDRDPSLALRTWATAPTSLEKAMPRIRILVSSMIPLLALQKANRLPPHEGLTLVASAKNPRVKRWVRTNRESSRKWVDKLPHLPEDTQAHHKLAGYNAEKHGALPVHRDRHPDGTANPKGGTPHPGAVSYDAYTPERQALHTKIIGKMVDHVRSADETQHPTAVVMMGGTASGKSTATKRLGYKDKDYVRLDADWVKEQFPEYQEAAQPRGNKDDPRRGETTATNAASMVHEESSEVMKMARDTAIDGRKPLIMDGTGADAKKYGEFIDRLKSAGYHIHLIMTDLDPEDAKERSAGRAEHTGRHVMHKIIDEVYANAPNNFEALSAKAHDATLWDNRPLGGRVVWERRGADEKTHDAKFVANFRQKHYSDGGGGTMLAKAVPVMDPHGKTNPTHNADEVNKRIRLALAHDHAERSRARPAEADRVPVGKGIVHTDDDSPFDL